MLMKFSLSKIALSAFLLSCAAGTAAHHSQAVFDTSRVITFEGTVKRFDWRNPHMYLQVETQKENGETYVQQIEGLAITQALVDGLKKEDLLPGMQVIVRANPNRRDRYNTIRGLNITTADGVVHPFYESNPVQPVLVPADTMSGHWAPSLGETGKAMAASRSWPLSKPGPRPYEEAGCMVEPVPFLTVINELRVIELRENEVLMRHDNSGDIVDRIIPLGLTTHPDNIVPSLFGHSIGRWEGNTLVIDTIGYAANDAGLFSGIPGGVRKQTIERLTLTEDRKQLRYEVTMTDPDFLTAPVEISMLWDHRPDLPLSSDPCEQEISDRFLSDGFLE
jgi:hypothetical protein